MDDSDDLASLPKKSIRAYAEVEDLAAITSRETHIDPHLVLLLAIRAVRALPKSMRAAFLTGDPAQRDELMMQWLRESLAAKGQEIDIREGDDYAARSKQVKKLVDQMHAIYEGVRGVAVESRKGSKGAK